MKAVIIDLGYRDYSWEEKAIKEVGGELVLAGTSSKNEIIDITHDAQALMVRQSIIDREVINALTDCRIIARYGIGVDNIDLEATSEKGIYVTNVKTYCYEEVADQTLAFILTSARKILLHDQVLRKGEWDINFREPIYRLKGKVLGIIGFGQIPRLLAKKVKGLDFKLIASDPYVSKQEMNAMGVEKVEFNYLLKESDFISLHAAVTKETYHLIGEKELKSMKKTVILINTSRGSLIDEEALVKALQGKWINYACLDVYEKEPLPMDSPLRKLSNCLLTDHYSWYSEESITEMQKIVAEQVALALKGEEPYSIVNRELLDRRMKG